MKDKSLIESVNNSPLYNNTITNNNFNQRYQDLDNDDIVSLQRRKALEDLLNEGLELQGGGEKKLELDEEFLYQKEYAASQTKLQNALKKLKGAEVKGSNWETYSSRLQERSEILKTQQEITSKVINLLKEQMNKFESDESWKALEIQKFELFNVYPCVMYH